MVKEDDGEKGDWNNGLTVSTLLHYSALQAFASLDLTRPIQLPRLPTYYSKNPRVFPEVKLQKSRRSQRWAISICLQYDWGLLGLVGPESRGTTSLQHLHGRLQGRHFTLG